MDLTNYDEVYNAYIEAKERQQHYEDELTDIKDEAEYEKQAIKDSEENLKGLRTDYKEAKENKHKAETELEEYQSYLNDLER